MKVYPLRFSFWCRPRLRPLDISIYMYTPGEPDMNGSKICHTSATFFHLDSRYHQYRYTPSQQNVQVMGKRVPEVKEEDGETSERPFV